MVRIQCSSIHFICSPFPRLRALGFAGFEHEHCDDKNSYQNPICAGPRARLYERRASVIATAEPLVRVRGRGRSLHVHAGKRLRNRPIGIELHNLHHGATSRTIYATRNRMMISAMVAATTSPDEGREPVTSCPASVAACAM